MPKRHVLILRLYISIDPDKPAGLFVCEDADTGKQCRFEDAQTLWRIVEATIAPRGRSGTQRRATASGRRNPASINKESS